MSSTQSPILTKLVALSDQIAAICADHQVAFTIMYSMPATINDEAQYYQVFGSDRGKLLPKIIELTHELAQQYTAANKSGNGYATLEQLCRDLYVFAKLPAGTRSQLLIDCTKSATIDAGSPDAAAACLQQHVAAYCARELAARRAAGQYGPYAPTTAQGMDEILRSLQSDTTLPPAVTSGAALLLRVTAQLRPTALLASLDVGPVQ